MAFQCGPPAGTHSPHNIGMCYTGYCNDDGFIMDNCLWEHQDVLDQFRVKAPTGIQPIFGGVAGRITTSDDDGQVPMLSGQQLRRSVSLSSNPNAETANTKANSQGSNKPKPFPVMALAIIGLIIYLIFK